MQIQAKEIRKSFNNRMIFKNIDIDVCSGQCVALTGANGSGKTTMIRILSHLIYPTSGKIVYRMDDKEIPKDEVYKHISLVGPYLELYQDLTARENLRFLGKLKRVADLDDKIEKLMKRFRLAGREEDDVKTYSSGMKQRLKYVFALLSDPQVLFVDEPGSNLDEEGVGTVYEVLEEQKKDKILVIATNDHDDLKFADRVVKIDG